MAIRLKDGLISIYIIAALITTGFIGLMVYEGVVDKGGVEAATITVDAGGSGDYLKIQDAIDAANPGDTINVKPGSYIENVVIDKRLILIGSGINNTKIVPSSGNAVEISADNVSFSKLRVHTYPPNGDRGIYLNGVKNCQIHNNSVSAELYGISMTDSNNNLIENNNASFSDWVNIYLYNSSFNKIINNTANDGSDSRGIRLSLSHSNEIVDNICNDSYNHGIEVFRSNQTVIKNNIINNNRVYNIVIRESNMATIIGNTIIENLNGIFLQSTRDNAIHNNTLINSTIVFVYGKEDDVASHRVDTTNTVDGNPVYFWKRESGKAIPQNAGQVILLNSSYIKIENLNSIDRYVDVLALYSDNITINNHRGNIKLFYTNDGLIDNVVNKPVQDYVDDTRAGIQLYQGHSHVIKNVNITSIRDGISLEYIKDSIVENNNCDFTLWLGIRLSYSDSNIVSNNTCSYNPRYHGLTISHSSYNIIENNICDYNTEYGIAISDGVHNIISSNSMTGNNLRGLTVNSDFEYNIIKNNDIMNNRVGMYLNNPTINNNTIFHNNIISNQWQLLDDGINYWNNSNQEGNYWSDYAGSDSNGDGIGDTNLPHKGVDNYPMMVKSSWRPETPTLSYAGGINYDGNYRLGWKITNKTTGYILEESNNDWFTNPKEIYSGPIPYFDVKNRDYGSYYYRVRSYNQDYYSKWSNVVNVKVEIKLEIPEEFKATAHPPGNSLNISWKVGQSIIDTYELYSNYTGSWEILQTLSYPNCAFNHSGLNDGVEYYYKLRSKSLKDYFSEFTENISAVPKDIVAPATPVGLYIKEVTVSSVTLEWNLNFEEDMAGYNIYRREYLDTSGWGEPLGTVDAVHDYFEDKDLEEEKTYFYAITAFDEVPNESEHTEMLSAFTELGPQAPEMNNTLLDFSIKEDCYNDLINLYLWFKDRNGDKLDFEVSGENSIDVHIYQDNGTVILRPDKNWNGQEELTFYADDGEFEFWDDVVITVTAVNDAPGPAKIISPKEGFETNDTTPIIFEGSCDLDPDLVYGDELTLSWSSNISGELGTGPTLKNIVLDGGMHEITLTVTDSENARCTQTRIIFVASTKGTQIVDDNTTDDDLDLIKPVKIDDDPFAFLGNLMILMGIIAGVIVAVIVIIVFLVMRKKRPEDTTAYGGEPTTYGGETEAGSWETPLAPAYTPEPVARSPEPEQVPIPVLSEEMRRGLSDGTVQYTKPVPADSTAPRLEDILAQMGGNELS